MAKAERIQHFLLVFDHHKGSLIRCEDFGLDSDRAVAAYAECEASYGHDLRYEIVLVGSDSIETVQVTHANYFDGTVAVSKYLKDILDHGTQLA